MTEQEAFDLNVIGKLAPLAIVGDKISIYDTAKMFWQARGEYEAERVKKLVEALEAITRVIADSPVKVYQEMERVAHRALREYQGGKDANA